MTAPGMQHYTSHRHTLAKNRYTVSDIVTSELTQGWRNPDPSITSIRRDFAFEAKPHLCFAGGGGILWRTFCLCVWESCMAICGHLVSVRRRCEMILSSTQIRLMVMHEHCNWEYIFNGHWIFWVYLEYYYDFGGGALLITTILPVLCIASISPFPQEKNENKK